MKGTELLSLPTELVILPQLARIAVQKIIAKGTDISQFNDECMLAVFVLRQKQLGDQSEFAPFVAELPSADQCNQVFLWTDQELELLEGSPIREKASSLRKGIEEEWQELDEVVFASNRNAFPAEFFSFKEYMWAQAIILSHCVSGGREMPLVLAPIASSVGLPEVGSKPSCLLQYRGGVFFSKPRLVLTSDRDVKPGEELTVSSASEMFNDSMLLDYGMASAEKQANRLELEFSISTLDKFFEEKECILEQEDLLAQQSFELREPSAKGNWEVPEFLESFVRLQCLGGMDVFLLETIFEKEIWGHMYYPVSVENEKAMCACIIGACEDALEAYPGQETSDTSSSKSDLVAIAISGEKSILEACKEYYVRHLASVDSFQYYHERRLDSLDLLRPLDENEIVDSESGVRMGRAFDENF